MVDDGRLSVDIAAALLRAIDPKDQPGRGDWQVGVTGPIDSPPDGWGRGGTDRWGGGGKGPAMCDIAQPSDNPGYLFSTDWREGKKMRGLTKRRKLTRLERKCELIKAGPFDEAPDMRAIEIQVAREFELGLLTA
jgi:hypothetical protein